MQIIECSQGDEIWHNSRSGVITASMFGLVRAKVGMLTEQQFHYAKQVQCGIDPKEAAKAAGYKVVPTSSGIQKFLAGEPVGDWSEAAKNYAFKLACERIASSLLDDSSGFETYAMRRGREMEETCRRRHEQDIGQIVDLAGFVVSDCGRFGCSADSLIEEDGGAEYKCFYDPAKVRPILTADDWGDIMDQVQGCMWITGRKWWDMCLFFPALAPVGKDFTRKRIERDESYIEMLEADLEDFDALVSQWQAALAEQKPA